MTDPRWFTDTKDGHSQWYVQRFRDLEAEGADLEGEARFVHALAAPGSRILDAGCGTGRLGAALHRWGHEVSSVDIDPVLISEAQQARPGPNYQVADLAQLELGERFDVVVSAGNVMVFLAPDTEQQVIDRLTAHVADGGALVLGFRLDLHLSLDALDRHLAAANFAVDARFGTWDLRPLGDDFAVTVARRQH